MKVGFDYADASMPRTVYYDSLCAHIRLHPDFAGECADADLVFPLEDTAIETNWPCYARPDFAFVRGSFAVEPHRRYLQRLVDAGRRLCLVNMHPFIRLPHVVSRATNIVVADINLRGWERSENPRTISMPALPITVGTFDPQAKRILASFRGVRSHPVRQQLALLHDGTRFICELVSPDNHFGKLDARTNQTDPAYVRLLHESLFAFVPRGDMEFSYRLLEVMSFGCIPIVLSDGLVLPFDRSIDWYATALHIPQDAVARVPEILLNLPPERVAAMQQAVVAVYTRHFAGFGPIVQSLLTEAELLLARMNEKSVPSPVCR